MTGEQEEIELLDPLREVRHAWVWVFFMILKRTVRIKKKKAKLAAESTPSEASTVAPLDCIVYADGSVEQLETVAPAVSSPRFPPEHIPRYMNFCIGAPLPPGPAAYRRLAAAYRRL